MNAVGAVGKSMKRANHFLPVSIYNNHKNTKVVTYSPYIIFEVSYFVRKRLLFRYIYVHSIQ